MIVGILAPAAILGTLALLVVLFFMRGREGVDLSPRGVLRLYLYIASLAGIVVFTVGLASVANHGIARVAGDEFIYGGTGPQATFAKCPPSTEGRPCVEPPAEEIERIRRQEQEQRERRRNEDLIRGLTFAVFGLLFWGAHWGARRGLGEDAGAPALRRGYLMLGTAVFGLATIVLVPTGVYQALANALLTTPQSFFRQGADALGGGIASLLIWLLYLRLAVAELRPGS